MAITLNHTIVPAHNKITSARFLARIFGLLFEERAVGYFAPVQVNETLTLDFHDDVERFDVHHYAFKAGEAEFDEIFGRIQAEGIPSPAMTAPNAMSAVWRTAVLTIGNDPIGHPGVIRQALQNRPRPSVQQEEGSQGPRLRRSSPITATTMRR